jgi:hypothetical protein
MELLLSFYRQSLVVVTISLLPLNKGDLMKEDITTQFATETKAFITPKGLVVFTDNLAENDNLCDINTCLTRLNKSIWQNLFEKSIYIISIHLFKEIF